MADIITIGNKRLEYLDLANKSFAAQNYQQANAFLDAFMTTIRENSLIANDIKKEFDQLEQKKIDTWNLVVTETSKDDTWTQNEKRSNNRVELAIQNLQDKIDVCWKIAMNHGAFND